jgi:hypothetical protein
MKKITMVMKIVYGIPINKTLRTRLNDWATNKESENYNPGVTAEELGFTELYHGGTEDVIGYCGVELGEIVDLVPTKLNRIRIKPDETEKVLVESLINSLSDIVKDCYSDLTPEVWVVPTTV